MGRTIIGWAVEAAALVMMAAEAAAGKTYYVDSALGRDGNSGQAPTEAFATVDGAIAWIEPGDELKIVGELANPSYNESFRYEGMPGDPHLWHAENTLRLNGLHGSSDGWIRISAFNETSILRGDGANIVRMTDCSYIIIEDFIIEGEVERIPYSTAKALQFVYKDSTGKLQYRVNSSLTDEEIGNLTDLPILGANVNRASYTDTRGIYISNSHHVKLLRNTVKNMPGGGIRVAYSEYVDIVGNEVTACSRKSYSGTHAVVVTYSKDSLPKENDDNYRIRIIGNNVHHNYNEIFSWVGTKSFIEARIDEGKGISLQRNQDFKNAGRILVANNMAYWNGYSGIHSQDGDNIDFISNTAYMNSYTNLNTYNGYPEEQRGNNIGISLQGGSNSRIVNNIAVVATGWNGFPISVSAVTGYLIVDSNLVFGLGSNPLSSDADLAGVETDTVPADPLFNGLATTDNLTSLVSFSIAQNSAGDGSANPRYLPCEDFSGSIRNCNCIGAIDWNSTLAMMKTINLDLDSCYSFFNRTEGTLADGKNSSKTWTVTVPVAMDGTMDFNDGLFSGNLESMIVKHPQGSDFRAGLLKFIPAANSKFVGELNDECQPEIVGVSLRLVSVSYDQDDSSSIEVYLNSAVWDEQQSNLSGMPLKESLGSYVGDAPIMLKKNESILLALDLALLCAEGRCVDSLDGFDLVVAATYDARVLEFYSKESGTATEPTLDFKLYCNRTDSRKNTSTSKPTPNPTSIPTSEPTILTGSPTTSPSNENTGDPIKTQQPTSHLNSSNSQKNSLAQLLLLLFSVAIKE